MHPFRRILFTAAVFLAASCAVGQEFYHPPDPDLMARLSYDNSGAIELGTVRHMCLAVSRDGEYRILRSLNSGSTERLHGKMSKEELAELSKLLGATEFRNLSGSHGGLIRQDAQTFSAEIPVGDHSDARQPQELPPHDAWRFQWLNGDGQNPFPASVSKVVDWLQRFQPKDGKTFEYTDYPDVCPIIGLRFVRPSVAENSHP